MPKWRRALDQMLSGPRRADSELVGVHRVVPLMWDSQIPYYCLPDTYAFDLFGEARLDEIMRQAGCAQRLTEVVTTTGGPPTQRLHSDPRPPAAMLVWGSIVDVWWVRMPTDHGSSTSWLMNGADWGSSPTRC